MHQRFRDQNQSTPDASGHDQPVKDQAGFDGFSQSDLVRKQHARRQPARDFGSDVQLVRNQIDSAADESANAQLTTMMLIFERGGAQIELPWGIGVSREESSFRRVEGD